MEIFQNIVLPLCVTLIILYGAVKRVKVFDCFIEGSKTGIETVLNILPALTALMVGVNMLSESGALDFISECMSPVADLFKIPREVIPLCLMSPLSGSGSNALLEEILNTYAPDSYIGLTASVICGASETTFYAISVYFSSVGISKTRHTLPSALIADITSFVMAAWTCRYLC